MKCLAYIRVSTKEQDENVQRKAIEEFAHAKGISIAWWYVDKGESGGKPFKDRPQALQLLKDIDVFKPDCVLSWSIDRLGRTMLDTVNTVLELENKGIKVITVKEEFLQTLDSMMRKLILSIFAWVAEYERRRIRERQEEAWRQGKQKGRPLKVSDEVIIKYYRTYVVERGLSLRDAWKIMRGDGINISYSRLKARVRKLKQEGKISVQLVFKNQ